VTIPHTSYPVMRMAYREYCDLPHSLSSEALEAAPIGFLFRCSGDGVVVGKIVGPLDIDCIQFGGRLALPEKFVNRYRVEFVGLPL